MMGGGSVGGTHKAGSGRSPKRARSTNENHTISMDARVPLVSQRWCGHAATRSARAPCEDTDPRPLCARLPGEIK